MEVFYIYIHPDGLELVAHQDLVEGVDARSSVYLYLRILLVLMKLHLSR